MDRNRGIDINALRQQLEDLLEDFLPTGAPRRPSAGRPSGDHVQTLAVNLADTEGAYILTAPLPGMRPEEIDVSLRGQSLSIRAQRKGQDGDRSGYLRREWGFASYQRGLDLPGPVDAAGAAASYRHGVITITLPKAEASRAQTIPIEEAEEETVEAAAPAPEETEAAPQPAEVEAEPEAEQAAEPTLAEAAEPVQRGSFYMTRGRSRGRDRRRMKSQEEPADQPPVEASEPEAAVEAPPAELEPVAAPQPEEPVAVAPDAAAEPPAPVEPEPASAEEPDAE